MAAGDEGGQFVFRLLPEYQKTGDSADAEKAKAMEKNKARLDVEKAKADAAQKELEELERQLKRAEEALKKGK
jgi:polyhydroxyalkanoate synthesis regulator phasin